MKTCKRNLRQEVSCTSGSLPAWRQDNLGYFFYDRGCKVEDATRPKSLVELPDCCGVFQDGT